MNSYSNDVLRTIMVKAIGLMLVFSNIQFAGIVVTLDSTPPSPLLCGETLNSTYQWATRGNAISHSGLNEITSGQLSLALPQ